MKASTKARRLENLRVALKKVRLTYQNYPDVVESADFLADFLASQVHELQLVSPDTRVERLANRSDVRMMDAGIRDHSTEIPPTPPYRVNEKISLGACNNHPTLLTEEISLSTEEIEKRESKWYEMLANSEKRQEILAKENNCPQYEILELLESFRMNNELTNTIHDNFGHYCRHFNSYVRCRKWGQARENNKRRYFEEKKRNDRYAAKQAAINQRYNEFLAAEAQRVAAL